MPDETPKPPLPKRPYKKKEPKQTPEEIENQCLLLTTREKAVAVLMCEMETPNLQVIAAKLHMDLDEVVQIIDSAAFKRFLVKQQDADVREFARLRVRKLRQMNISRGAIEQRLYDLMMLDPKDTKGNIDGQVKAAAALADKFGYSKTEDPLAGKSPDELKAIVRKGHTLLLEGNTGVN